MKATLGMICGLVITIFLLSSCASTGKERVPTTWMDASYSGKPLESVLVVGFTDNLENRKLFEDTFLQYFRDNRITAHSSIVALGESKKLESDSIKQAAEELGLETVLVTHLVGVTEKEGFTPPGVDARPYNSLSDEYKELAGKYKSDYIYKYEVVTLKTNLYEVATEKLFWSYTSQTSLIANVESFMATVGTDVMEKLKKDDLIQ